MSERRKHKAADIPLLDEVNELIEKERLLLGLQLLEQKKEAEEWKAKYDTLVGKVSDNIADTEDFDALEFAAETYVEKRVDFISQFDLNLLLKNQKHPWVVDLSHANIEPAVFANTMKSLFSSKSVGSDFSVAILNHCCLNDENTAALIALFRNSDLQGIDLSYNDLSEVFFLQLVEVLKNRRKSPQYLLLDNNVPLTMTVKHFPALVDALSDSLWGLSVSLEDFPSHMTHRNHHRHHQTQHHASHNDYKETSKNPMKAYEFLNALRQLWLPEGQREDGQTNTKKKNKAGAGGKPKPGKAEATGRAGRPHPLQSLSVLGLRHAHLSRRSVACLEATLRLTLTSLTDLDLTFALAGYAGAEALRKILSLKDCQLVRLGLMGNALGDAGVKLLSQPLQTNKCLTYLDLRSNDITSLGLRSLESALTRNRVLYRLDLRNNPGISLQASTALQQLLRSHGAEVQVTFTGATSTTSTSSSAAAAAAPLVIFRSPARVKHTVPLDRPTLLFSIDFNRINAQHPAEVDLPKALDWLMRPARTNKSLSVLDRQQTVPGHSNRSSVMRSSLTGTAAAAPSTVSGDDAYLALNQFSLSVEVRVSSALGGPARTLPLPCTSYVTRCAVDADVRQAEGSDWMRGRVVLSPQELPGGSVDVFLVLRDKQGERPSNAGGDCLVFEGSALTVTAVAPQETYCLYDEQQSDGNAGGSLLLPGRLLSPSLTRAVASAGRGSVLRCFKWSVEYPRVQLHCDLKLGAVSAAAVTTAATGTTTTVADNAALPAQHETLGYEWFLTVYSIDGTSRLMASGRCLGTSNPFTPTTAATTTTAAAAPLLEAWIWKRITVSFTGPPLRLDDLVLLSARPVSTQAKYPASLLRRCQVLAQSCSLTTSLHRSAAGPDDVSGEQPSEESGEPEHTASDGGSSNSELVNLLGQESHYLSYVHNDDNCLFPA